MAEQQATEQQLVAPATRLVQVIDSCEEYAQRSSFDAFPSDVDTIEPIPCTEATANELTEIVECCRPHIRYDEAQGDVAHAVVRSNDRYSCILWL